MATLEMSTEDNHKEKMSPTEEEFPPFLQYTSAPMNFSELTPSQFGISIQSFTPASVPNCKDKSRLAQIKARRRSNIGVRGSPETNSLIRFMAQQKMKTPPALKTPELVRRSPFLPRVASTLRQKMASFQSLMNVEESEVCDLSSGQDSSAGRCMKTRDDLSDGNSHDGGKENHPPLMTPTPNKRRRLDPVEACESEIREPGAPVLRFSFKEQEEDEEDVTGRLTSSDPAAEARAVLLSPPFCVDFDLQDSYLEENKQDAIFELQSLSQPSPDDPAAAAPALPASSFGNPSLPSLLEMKPAGEGIKSTQKSKKKSVRFGVPLSPEFFDKNLPPSTPLQKGGTPARAPTPGGSLQLRSLLKTPQRNESQTAPAQPSLGSPTGFGASPTLAIPRSRRMQSVGEDSEDMDGKIVFPSMDEADCAVTYDPEHSWEAQPLNLDTAFHEESLSQIVTEPEPSTASQMDVQKEPISSLEQDPQPEADPDAPVKTRKRRKKPPQESESTSEAPARPGSRKRKPEESEPMKRSTRSAAKSASGKIKTASTAARRWNRDVDRTLYSSRVYASKDPTLSPITESLSFISETALQIPSTNCTASNDDNSLSSEMTEDSQALCDPAVTNTLENPSKDAIESFNSSNESSTRRGRGRRRSGPSTGGRRLKKSRVSAAEVVLVSKDTQDQIRGKTEEHCEDQTSSCLDRSREAPLTLTVPEHTAGTQVTDPEGKPEHLDSPASADNVSNQPSEPAQTKARRGRRSSVSRSEPENQTQEDAGREVEEKDQAAPQQEDTRSSSESQEEEQGAAGADLAPWQADFNLEDMFKPVATRGQRSVRRSLRNKSNQEHGSCDSAGLAWLPRTSPDCNKEARRRTRGRRLSSAQPVQALVPEEAQDES
ncbi:uncharacterized protein V6R79_009298 [Siganus canaliculatus]